MKKLIKYYVFTVLGLALVFSLFGNAMTVKATPGYYKITFSANGDSGVSNLPATCEVASGAIYTVPKSPVPSKSGYTFAGYYDQSNPSSVYQPGSRLTDSLQKSYVLIPKWTKNSTPKYSISLTSVNAARGGETKKITVNPQGSTWKVSNNSGSEWITAKKDSNTLVLTIKENESTGKRSAKVAITIGDKNKGQVVTTFTVTVTQEPNYHYVTLNAVDGTIYGKKTYGFKVKRGTTVSSAISNKSKPVGKVGRVFVQYTDEKDPATRTKSEQYIKQLYGRKIEKDITLYALYWVDLSKYEKINPNQKRVTDIWKQKIACGGSSILNFLAECITIGGANDSQAYYNSVDNAIAQSKRGGEYGLNDNRSLEARLINDQNELYMYHIGNNTMDNAGCGVVACYNARTLLGVKTDLVKIIEKVDDKGYMLLGGTVGAGFVGLNPSYVKETINYDGNKLNVQTFDKSTSFDEAVLNDLTMMRGDGTSQKVVYIVCYWNQDSIGSAHYVCFVPDYNEYRGFVLHAYNRSNLKCANSVLAIINNDHANKENAKIFSDYDANVTKYDRFIAGYRITR